MTHDDGPWTSERGRTFCLSLKLSSYSYTLLLPNQLNCAAKKFTVKLHWRNQAFQSVSCLTGRDRAILAPPSWRLFPFQWILSMPWDHMYFLIWLLLNTFMYIKILTLSLSFQVSPNFFLLNGAIDEKEYYQKKWREIQRTTTAIKLCF